MSVYRVVLVHFDPSTGALRNKPAEGTRRYYCVANVWQNIVLGSARIPEPYKPLLCEKSSAALFESRTDAERAAAHLTILGS